MTAKSTCIWDTIASLDKLLHFSVLWERHYKSKLSYLEVLTFLWVWTLQLMQMSLILTSCVQSIASSQIITKQNMLSTKHVIWKETFCPLSIQVRGSSEISESELPKKITTPIHVKWPDFLYISVSNINWWKSVERNFHQFTIREREKVGNVPWLPIQR